MKNGSSRSTKIPSRRIELGEHIVSDPAVCHGKVTFKGTRIFVADVLADVESGLSWDFIIRRWGAGKLSKAAIAEALHLGRNAWLDEDGRLTPRGAKSRWANAA
jgi:uncharacterized protein (DUF433 family)